MQFKTNKKNNHPLLRHFLGVVVLLIFIDSARAQTTKPEAKWWMPSIGGLINAVAKDTANDIVYIGGNFTRLIFPAPFGATLSANSSDGAPSYEEAHPNGVVNAAAADGSGGWYIGGNFTAVGGQLRNRLAHIDASGQVTSWNPNVSGYINTILVNGGVVYVGGNFAAIGGQARNHVAAIDAVTGTPTSWNPNASGEVTVLTKDGSLVYAGGFFSSIGGQLRSYLAAVDITTGVANSWDPSPDGGVFSLVANGGLLFVGGSFSTIGGQTHNLLAAIDVNTGLSTNWDAGVVGSAPIRALQTDGNLLYVGGQFTTIGGQTRRKVAAISLSTGLADSWNPSLTGGSVVQSLWLNGNVVYIGGDFEKVGGQTRPYFTAVDATTGSLTSWAPIVDGGAVNAIGVNGNDIYVGGNFTGFNPVDRNRLAALNATTGAPTSWNPDADDQINAIILGGNNLYVGGRFSTVGGQSRSKIAAIDKTSGAVTAWNPTASGEVKILCLGTSELYVAGDFASIGGQARNYVAAVDLSTGIAKSWNPNPDNRILSLAVNGTNVYIGGWFSTIGGQSRNYIAAVNKTTGLATSWNPNSDYGVFGIAIKGTKVYTAGGFTNIGGQARNGVAELDKTTGLASSWNPNVGIFGDGVKSMAINTNTLYISGSFGSISGQARQNLGAIDVLSGQPTSWTVGNGNNRTLSIAGGDVYVCGNFNAIGASNEYARQAFAVFSPCENVIKPGAITQSGGATKVCPGETRTYTIAAVANSESYNWVVPAGASIVNGQGTTSIDVSFNGSFAATDTIKVASVGNCGSSDYRTKAVSKGSAPNTPSAITGDNYGQCTASGTPYSVTNVADVTYAWSFDNANGAVATGQGTNAITANFTPGALTTVLSVTAANGCGTSNPRTKTIYAKPSAPASITGSAAVCAHATGVAYSTPAVAGASTYTWKAPAGSHISDGVTTSTGTSLTTSSNSVTVNFGATAGNVQVRANNTCGSSGYFFKPVAMNCRTINGVEEAIGSGDVTVYPNPATDQVSLSFSSDKAGEYTVHLYDVIGKEVMTITGTAVPGSNQVELNTSSFASGIYHLVLKGTGLDYNTKLVLDK